MSEFKPCPFCGSSRIEDCYIYMKCLSCGTKGPIQNNGNFDHHADHVDHENAIKTWNTRSGIEEEEG